MTTIVVAVAALIVPALTAPAAAAETVTLQCATTLGIPNVIECSTETAVHEGSLRCESPGVITSLGGVFTVAPTRCTGTFSNPFSTGDGELDADFLTIDTATGTVSILNGTAALSLTQPQTGSSLAITCAGSVLVLTVNPLTLNTPLGTCGGDLTVNLPGGGIAQAGMVCTGSIALTTTPLALLIPAGSCEGEMTVTVPGVGTMHITADNPTITFITDPVPVLTVAGPNVTVEITLVGGMTQTVQCSSAVVVDFSRSPLLTIPQTLCTT